MKLFTLTALVLVLCACETSSPLIPRGYTGATAVIRDSAANVSDSSGDYFFIYRVNGYEVANALFETRNDHTFDPLLSRPTSLMSPKVVDRQVAARPATYTIVAASAYATPELEIAHPLYTIAGDLVFSPEPGAAYVVRGSLGPEQSSVWIENEATGAVVAGKFVALGSSSAALLRKAPAVEFVPAT